MAHYDAWLQSGFRIMDDYCPYVARFVADATEYLAQIGVNIAVSRYVVVFKDHTEKKIAAIHMPLWLKHFYCEPPCFFENIKIKPIEFLIGIQKLANIKMTISRCLPMPIADEINEQMPYVEKICDSMLSKSTINS